jgi:hypothetical protein
MPQIKIHFELATGLLHSSWPGCFPTSISLHLDEPEGKYTLIPNKILMLCRFIEEEDTDYRDGNIVDHTSQIRKENIHWATVRRVVINTYRKHN